jgi:hypothetical protein
VTSKGASNSPPHHRRCQQQAGGSVADEIIQQVIISFGGLSEYEEVLFPGADNSLDLNASGGRSNGTAAQRRRCALWQVL